MKKRLKRSLLAACMCMTVGTSAIAADNLIVNPSFESSETIIYDPNGFAIYDGWIGFGGNFEIVDLGTEAKDGDYALRIRNINPGFGAPIMFQLQNRFPVQPGDEVYARAFLKSDVDATIVDGATNRIMKIAFFDDNNNEVILDDANGDPLNDPNTGLPLVDENGDPIVIRFSDGGVDIAPAKVLKGIADVGDGECFEFPGVIADPKLTAESTAGEWQQSKAHAIAATSENQIVATCKDFNADGEFSVEDVDGNLEAIANTPPGAASVGLFLFNINFTGVPADVYFDEVFLGVLQPDDDSDRIENSVDSDPITISTDFSDGTTSGSIESDPASILAIDDAGDSKGVFVASDPGNQQNNNIFARISVCGSLASIRVTPGSAFDVTCGSVITNVAEGSAPVEIDVEINGDIATVTVPAGYQTTYDEETDSITPVITADSETPTEPVTITIGSAVTQLVAGQELVLGFGMDIKPGDETNCVNSDGNGVIPVAILGKSGSPLKVSDIVTESLEFDGLAARVRGNGLPSCNIEDVNLDGVDDMICQFEDKEANWASGNSTAKLIGKLIDNTDIYLTDSLCVK